MDYYADDNRRIREMVERIKNGSAQGLEDLHRLLSRGIRLMLCRQAGPDHAEDLFHEIFRIVADAILHDKLRDPERLRGFVKTVVQRQIAGHIDREVRKRGLLTDLTVEIPDSRSDPERDVIEQQRIGLMTTTLKWLSARDREVLVRFYIHEQCPEQICREMKLSETQFRLVKSRAKGKFGSLVKKKMASRALLLSAQHSAVAGS